MADNIQLKMRGFLKIHDPNTGEVFVDKDNAINYENMSISLAQTLSNRGYGSIYQMAFGNGGSSVSDNGVITYLPPNTTGTTAALYNQTYIKVVDDTSINDVDPLNNKMTVYHVSGKTYTDIIVSCLLDYGEPSNQMAFDNSSEITSEYVFDELGLVANYGTNASGQEVSRLLTHVIFHPIQKALNRQIQIDYTVRIQTISSV